MMPSTPTPSQNESYSDQKNNSLAFNVPWVIYIVISIGLPLTLVAIYALYRLVGTL